MKTQLMKGVIEVYVLTEVQKKQSYGYELLQNLNKYFQITESTLYPILRRLEEAEELETYNIIHNGRNRKYYKITNKGINHINEFVNAWYEILNTLKLIREDNPL